MSIDTTGLDQRAFRKQHAVARLLEREIGSGRFAGAEVLPGERELSRILKTSRTTLRAALRSLVADKLVVQRHGYGTVIIRSRDPELGGPGAGARTLIAISFAWDLIRHRGFDAVASEQDTRIGPPGPDDAWLLRARSNETVQESRRLLLAGNDPVASERIVVPQRFAAPVDLPQPPEEISVSIAPLSLCRTVQRLRSVPLSGSAARRLQAPEGSPAIIVTRLHLLNDGSSCCLTEATLRPEWLDLVTEVPTARL